MIVSDAGQSKVFVINILFGIMCVVLFDVFHVLVNRYGKNRHTINLLDACYLMLTFVVVLYSSLKFNFGAWRYYQLLGLIMGGLFWWLCFSYVERKIIDKLIVLSIRLIRFLIRLLTAPVFFVLRVFFTPVEWAEQKTDAALKKMNKKAKKVKMKKEKSKEIVKKRLKMI